MKRLILIGCLSVLSFVNVCGQKISISKVELAGSKIVVYYSLEESNPNAEYLLSLYCSRDNFTAPLLKVRGDVGAGMKQGANKKIEWEAAEEIGTYKGKLALEIKGRVYVPVVKLEDFSTKKTYKRGNAYQLVWRSGDPGGQVHIELYKDGERISGERNLSNNGSYTWHVPAGTKAGKNYQLKFTNAKTADEAVQSSSFRIARKVPLLLKVLPILGIGGAAVVLGGEGSPSSNQIPLPGLPGN